MHTIYLSVNACAGMFTSAEMHTDYTYVHPSASTFHMVSGVSAACQWVHEEAGVVVACVLPGLYVSRCQTLEEWWTHPLGDQLSTAQTCAEGSTAIITSAVLRWHSEGRALGSVYMCTGDCLKRFMLYVNQRQMKPGLGFREEGYPVGTLLQRLLLALFYVWPFSASLCYRIIKYIFHIK